MKRLFSLFTMLIAITSFAVAQTNVTPVDATTPEKVGGPNMKFEIHLN